MANRSGEGVEDNEGNEPSLLFTFRAANIHKKKRSKK